MARIALALVGAIAGFVLTGFNPLGAKIGWMVGSLAGALLFAPKGQNTTNEGPRLQDLTVSSSAFGQPITLGYGCIRLPGNMIWSSGIKETKHTDTQETGGAKGGGGNTVTNITYTYSASFAIGFAVGPATVLKKMWADGKIIYDVADTSVDANSGVVITIPQDKSLLNKFQNFTFYKGTEDQLPDPTIQADKGVDNTPAFRGMAYIVFRDAPLADFGNRIPNITALICFDTVPATFPLTVIPVTRQKDQIGLDPLRPYLYVVGADIDGGTFDTLLSRINTTTMVVEQTARYPNVTYGANGDHVPVVDADGFVYLRMGTGSAHIYKIDGLTLNIVSDLGTLGSANPTWSMIAFDTPAGLKCLGVLSNLSEITVMNRAVGGVLATATGTFGGGGITNQGWAIVADSSGRVWSLHGKATTNFTGLTCVDITKPVVTGTPGFTVNQYDISGVIESGQAMLYYSPDNSLVIGTNIIASTGTTLPLSDGLLKWDINSKTVVDVLYAVNTNGTGSFVGAWLASAFQSASGGFLVFDLNDAFYRVNLSDLSVQQSYSLTDYGSGSVFGMAYDAASNSVWAVTVGGVERLYLDRISNGDGPNTTLDKIVSDLSQRAGLQMTDFDVTALAPIGVRGYAIARQLPVRSAVEPLAQAFFFDGFESDGKVRFKLRGGAVEADVGEVDLQAHDGDASKEDKPEPKLEELRTQEVDLAARIDLLFMDPATDYQQGTQHAKRITQPVPSMASQETTTLDFPIVFTTTEAKQVAEKSLYLFWIQRNSFQFKLMPRWMRLDPTDVINLHYKNKIFRMRLVQTDLGAGYVLACQSLAEDEVVYISDAVGNPGDGGTPPGPPTVISATQLILMDTPLLRDGDLNDATSGMYIALGAFQDGWPGAVVYKSIDNQSWNSVTSGTAETIWGKTVNALPDPASPHTWDYGDPLYVKIAHGGGAGGSPVVPVIVDPTVDTGGQTGADEDLGALANVTDLDVLNGANAAAILGPKGWEIIQFRDAVLQADGTYALSTRLRGRRGTEWAAYGHAAGEMFVLLNAATVGHLKIPTSELNADRYYKGVTIGDMASNAPSQKQVLVGNDLKPYAPCSIHGSRDGSNNLTITWIRRSRANGAWLNFIGTVPLNEASEAYELDVLDNLGAVKRTITGLTAATASYSAANQTSDGFTPGQAISVKVYQIGKIGRGFAGVATI